MPFVKRLFIHTAPVDLPASVLAKARDNFRRALDNGEVRDRFISKVVIDPAVWRVPAIGNGSSLDGVKVGKGGLSFTVSELKRVMNVEARQQAFIEETLAFLDRPDQFVAAVEHYSSRFLKNAAAALRGSGGAFGLPRAATAAVKILAGDTRGLADLPGGLMTILLNNPPTQNVFAANRTNQAIAAGTQAFQQLISFLVAGLSVGFSGAAGSAAFLAAVSELTARSASILEAYKDPGITTITVFAVADPIGVEVRAFV